MYGSNREDTKVFLFMLGAIGASLLLVGFAIGLALG